MSRNLKEMGFNSTILHGGKLQEQRQDSINGFREGRYDVLVATNVAGRGIDIPDVQAVVNYDVPNNIQDYTHRIGRTGRAGKEGHAFTLTTRSDEKFLDGVERLLGRPIPPISIDGDATSPATSTDTTTKSDATAKKDDSEKPPRRRRRGSRSKDTAPANETANAQDAKTDDNESVADASPVAASETAPEPRERYLTPNAAGDARLHRAEEAPSRHLPPP